MISHKIYIGACTLCNSPLKQKAIQKFPTSLPGGISYQLGTFGKLKKMPQNS